jgi:hypothetical protein
MKANEAQALLTNLLSEAEKAHQLAKTATRAKQSLRGDGPYARRFHAAVIALSTTEGKLRPILSGLQLTPADLDGFNGSLSVLKGDDAKPKDRSASLKRLRLLCESVILQKVQGMTASPVPVTEQVLPLSVVQGTRRNYIVQVVVQANGSYEHQWYDACSVMIRRLVETLIIEVYDAKGEAEEIKKDGHFFMLSKLIDNIEKKAAWNLGRETQAAFPLLKQLGDRSAHNRRYIATKQDIDRVIPGLRVLTDDLLHLAGLK